jgi:hypothetical protein
MEQLPAGVGKFLDYKLELGETDAGYAYARWMAHHERPYYDQRRRLEYPTET